LVIPASVVIILTGCLLYVRGKKCTYNTLLGFGSFILHASIELIFGFPVSFPGEWDGAGAVVKRALRMHQIQHPKEELANAEQCVEFLHSSFTSRALSSYEQSTTECVRREFWYIKVDDVDKSNNWACRMISGSRKLHLVLGFYESDPTFLMVRELTCFCGPCIDEDWSNCEQRSHVSEPRVVRLRPVDTHQVRLQIETNDDPEDWEYGGVDEEIGDLLRVGENFAVPAPEGNDEGVEFYVLQCQRAKFMVEEDFVCPWEGDFKRGDYAVAGTYYMKHGRSADLYVFLDTSSMAHVDVHLIRACKFPMFLAAYSVKGHSIVYKMTEETRAVIEEALRDWWAQE
jgi:hypothetical protein